MEKNMINYKFLNAKDRAAERKRGSGVMDTDRYHYKTAPHVQNSKRKRDSEGFFAPYAMFRPYSGTGLLCAIFGETPTRKTSDLRATQDSFGTYGGMCGYNFEEFFRPGDIECENDLRIQELFLKRINWLLDEGILEKE